MKPMGPPTTNNRFDAYTNPLATLARRPKVKSNPKAASTPPPPKSDPFPAEEPLTGDIRPAARASRLLAAWNALPPWKQKIAEQVIAAMQESA